MYPHCARDCAYGTRADSILPGCSDCRLPQLRMIAETEVVVTGKVDNLPSVIGAERRLFILQHAQSEVRAPLTQVVKSSRKVGHLWPRRMIRRSRFGGSGAGVGDFSAHD